MCAKIVQSSGGKKWEYTVVKILHYMQNGILLEGCNKLKMYVINPKATTKLIKESVIANKPTKDMKQNHIQLIQKKTCKEEKGKHPTDETTKNKKVYLYQPYQYLH